MGFVPKFGHVGSESARARSIGLAKVNRADRVPGSRTEGDQAGVVFVEHVIVDSRRENEGPRASRVCFSFDFARRGFRSIFIR